MRKVHFLLFICTAFSGCSVPFHFHIYNVSEKDILVTYTYLEEAVHYGFNSNPKIMNFRKVGKLKKEKHQNIVLDSVNNSVSCVLKKGQALWIGTITNFHLNSPFKEKMLYGNLDDLRVKTSEKEVLVHGEEVVKLFEEIRNQYYGIKIK